jgi:hypothetical protein
MKCFLSVSKYYFFTNVHKTFLKTLLLGHIHSAHFYSQKIRWMFYTAANQIKIEISSL